MHFFSDAAIKLKIERVKNIASYLVDNMKLWLNRQLFTNNTKQFFTLYRIKVVNNFKFLAIY